MTIDTKRLKTDAAYWDAVAPEGAEHLAIAPDNTIIFYRQDSVGTWQIWGVRHEQWMFDGFSHDAGRPPYEMISRPTKPAAPEWGGYVDAGDNTKEWKDGLPPVGCECEANNGGNSEYFKCVVVAYHYKTGRPILETENSSLHMLTEKPDCWNIRPIRTRQDMQREELKRLIADSERYGHDHTTDTILSHYNLEPKP